MDNDILETRKVYTKVYIVKCSGCKEKVERNKKFGPVVCYTCKTKKNNAYSLKLWKQKRLTNKDKSSLHM